MQGTHDPQAGRTTPPDWPAPDAPLPGEEPTVELPAVTESMLAEHPWTGPTLARAALSLALTRREGPEALPGPDAPGHDGDPPHADPADSPHSDTGNPPRFDAADPPRSGPASGHDGGSAGYEPASLQTAGLQAAGLEADLEAAGFEAAGLQAAGLEAEGFEAEGFEAGGGDGAGFARDEVGGLDAIGLGGMSDTGGFAVVGSGFGERWGAGEEGGSAGRPGVAAEVSGQADGRGAGTAGVGVPDKELGSAPGRRWLIGAGIAAAALLLTGVSVVALGRGGDEPGDGRRWTPPAAGGTAPGAGGPGGAAPGGVAPGNGRDGSGPGHTATAALGGRTAAVLDLIDGARTVTLRTADLGDDLYRISTPAGPAVPRADERDGRIQVRLDGSPEAVDVALSTRVRWDLRVAGGAELSTIDLSGGRVGGVDLSGGAGRIRLTLPEPDGTLSVRMSGGVDLFDVRTAGAAPVRVRVGHGAGQVVLDGRTHQGVAAGQIFTPRAWGDTANRVDVDAVAGLSALTVAPTGR